MLRSAIAVALFVGAFSPGLASVASFAHPDSDTELSAEAQMLPPDLVENLKSEPPSRGMFDDRIFCKVHTSSTQSPQIPYCMCYGKLTCSELARSGRCNSRLGWFDGDGMAVCRANGNYPYAREPVTIVG